MLEVNDLRFAYGKSEVLHGISHSFKNGALTVLLGPNGSGKSTFLKVLGGEKPSGGNALLDGVDLHAYPPASLARSMAFLSQNMAVLFDFTVQEIVMMGRNPYIKFLETETDEDLQQVQNAMTATSIQHLAQRSILTLSGGEQQRVLLARSIAQGSKYLLLDEPITGLDIRHQLEFIQLLKRQCEEGKKTVICVLHDLELAAQYADELILLHEGSIYAKGSAPEILTERVIKEVYGINAQLFLKDGQYFLYKTL